MDRGLLIETLVLIAFSILGTWEGIRFLKYEYITRDLIGPGGYLVLIFPLLFISTIVYFLRSYPKSSGGVRKRWILPQIGPSVRLMAVLGLYGVVVSNLGYAIGSGLFFILAFKISGVRSWLRSVVLGLVVALVFELVFSRVARIPFP